MLGGRNQFLTPAYNWTHDSIRYWHPGLGPEVGSSLEYEYIVTCGAVKAACYSPYVRQSLGGVGARILGGIVRWVVGLVCGRMLSWCEMAKALIWGRVMEFCSDCEWV